ncbi:MAG: YraN family protein [Holosporaceae bacterium]|jgi:putative endonuclease|nr:YraN family protein [Holosporaceae bacterium]
MNPTELKGYFGEFIAVLLLKVKGYNIVARRYKTICGEIDIIASKRDTIVFIEVKSRKNLEKCHNAILARQINRIIRASEIFLARNPKMHSTSIRYDVILVPDWSFPKHIENISI